MNQLTLDLQPAYPSYREIPLTQGQVAIVDETNYRALAAYKWYAYWSPSNKTYYARRNQTEKGGKRVTVLMHRVVLSAQAGKEIDHINGNGTDNRKTNLRVATCSQNCQNQTAKASNKCGFKGVCLHPRNRNWVAKIMREGRSYHIGVFDTPEEASAAYAEAAKRLHGDFANLGPRQTPPERAPSRANSYTKHDSAGRFIQQATEASTYTQKEAKEKHT